MTAPYSYPFDIVLDNDDRAETSDNITAEHPNLLTAADERLSLVAQLIGQ